MTVEVSAECLAILPDVSSSNQVTAVEVKRSRSKSKSPSASKCSERIAAKSALSGCIINSKVRHLEEKLNEQYSNLNITCFVDNSVVKLCGTWDDIDTIHKWLKQLADELQKQHDEIVTKSSVDTNSVCDVDSKPKQHLSARRNEKQQITKTAVDVKKTLRKSQRLPRRVKNDKIKPRDETEVPVTITSDLTETDCKPSDNKIALELTTGTSYVCDVCKFSTNVQSDATIHAQLAQELKCIRSQPEKQLLDSANAHLKRSQQLTNSCSTVLVELNCTACNYVTTKRRNLTLHMTRIHGDKLYACTMCDRSFAIAKDLRQHVKFHTDVYCCEQCGRTLKSK